MADLRSILENVLSVFNEINSCSFPSVDQPVNLGRLETLNIRAEECLRLLRTTVRRVTEIQENQRTDSFFQLRRDFEQLCTAFETAYNRFVESIPNSNYDLNFRCQRERVFGPGRRTVVITRQQIEALREIHFSWSSIARLLGVSERTLERRRREFQMPIGKACYSDISDEELDRIVSQIIGLTPNAGETLVQGALRRRGLSVQRRRRRESILRVDPISRLLRRRQLIYRRHYQVRAPNSLWHVDGNHKLIRWRFVIHGAIDGYSRLVTFLQCSTNNQATTVLQYFTTAIGRFGCPSRVRTDMGLENIEIARYMLMRRGVGRGSIITGSSVHNQRIERLWRDVFRCVSYQFRNIFVFMEGNGLLDPLNEVHLFCLQHVYLPRINRALDEFAEQWNQHPVSTAENQSPSQLWVSGMLASANTSLVAVRDIMDGNEDPLFLQNYGIDEDGPMVNNGDDNIVNVPPITFELSQQQEHLIMNQIDALIEDYNYGINTFIRMVNLLQGFA